MIRVAVLLLSMLVTLSPARALAQTTDEQTVMSLEREWERAIQTKDHATLNRLVADDAVIVSSIGELMTKSQNTIETQLTTLSQSQIIDLAVRVFGNVAIVVGSNSETSSNRTTNTSGLYRWTDVWVKRNGQWQVVSAQSTKIE